MIKLRTLVSIYAIFSLFLVDGYNCKIVQFIFGDSLSDVGNNNYLSKSLARASLPWYGIDFGNGLPNGRFSNGRTVADIIGDTMGLPRPPAFLDPSLNEDLILENGVNYASGGGGILNETGSYFVQRFGLYKQIELFQGTQDLIRAKIGENEADKFFKEARYVVALGSNDFINNYLMPVYSDSWTYSDNTFIKYLMDTLRNQLIVSHHHIQAMLETEDTGPRSRPVSGAARFRRPTADGVRAGADGLHPTSKSAQYISLPNATFRFGDAYDVVNDLITNPNQYGFSNSDSPCCSFGKIRPALTCIPASTLCKDRSKYVFWDEYHPSDSANQLIAKEMIKKLGFKPVNQTDSPSPAPSISPSVDGN
ncbi:hypothetical protein DH2020_038068 [Rehmannia glutinosa]|uniref:GDSL esterase/lipase n=1 Tax=Rehmannia glutinosa TaxID=99300 RepID=A0ABR0V0T5_REHGL